MKPQGKLKTAVIAWIGIYPTINLLNLLFERSLAGAPLLLRTFVLTIMMVPIVVLYLMPRLNKFSSKWLSK
jgi:antibiotic biosynthesis monooxygenase (ABM) superfamily enzyme